MPDEAPHPIEEQIKEIDARKAAQKKDENPFAYNPATHDSFVKNAVNPWALDDTVKNSLLSCKTNLVVGATYPSGASTSADRLKVSVTADYLTVGGVGLAGVNVTASTLDTGTLAVSTWYAVHVICDARGEQISGLLSLSGTAPALPAGKTLFRRVGWVRTGGGVAEFFRVLHVGDWWHWNEILEADPFRVVNAGTDSAYAAGGTSCAAVAPTTSREVRLNVVVKANDAGGAYPGVGIRPHGSNRASDWGTMIGAAGVSLWANGDYLAHQVHMVTDSSQKIGYSNYDTKQQTTIIVTGYLDIV